MKRARILAAFVAALLVVSLTATVAVAAPGTTERVSVSSAEVQGNGISGRFGPSALSADGLTAAFDSEASNLVTGDTNVVVDVFARDRDTGITERVSVSSSEVQGNDDSDTAAVNGDGQIVAFDSDATNLVSPDTNASDDVFATAGSCAVAGSVVTCSLGNIAVGASVTVTIRVTPTRSGSLTNMATVSFSGTDPDPVDNMDSETTTVRR